MPPSASAQPPRLISLTEQGKRINVDAASEYWVDESGKASVIDVNANQCSTGTLNPSANAERQNLTGKALWIRFDNQTAPPIRIGF
jgi:hypothetical protein